MKKRHPHKSNILLVNITRLGDMLQATPTISGVPRPVSAAEARKADSRGTATGGSQTTGWMER